MLRRQLGCTAAAAIAAGMMIVAGGLPAAAEQARPQIETTKVDGTDNVYIFRNGNAQSMFIVTRDGVIATDPIAYGRPNGGQQYVDEIRKITDKPIKYLIYSHHHFDHIAGGKAFKDAGATVIAHRNAQKRLAALRDPHTVLPDRAVGRRAVIRLGGTRLELHYLGLNHSDSNLVMYLPKEKIIFLVDTIPAGQMPGGRGFIDIYPLETEEFIQRVLALDWERMIPGHPGINGRLGTREDARNALTFMQEASAEIQKLAREGKCWEPVEREFKMPKYESWPNYATALPFVSRRYCGLWGRGT